MKSVEENMIGTSFYDVVIVEKLEKTVTVEARDAAEAEEIAEDRWNKSEWVLTSDNFTEAEFHAVSKNFR